MTFFIVVGGVRVGRFSEREDAVAALQFVESGFVIVDFVVED